MENENKNELQNEAPENMIYTLVDENGVESDFEVLDQVEYKGKIYFAMVPVKEEEKHLTEEEGVTIEEYVILRVDVDENGENTLVSVDDDEENDAVADLFDDRFSEEYDYDQK